MLKRTTLRRQRTLAPPRQQRSIDSKATRTRPWLTRASSLATTSHAVSSLPDRMEASRRARHQCPRAGDMVRRLHGSMVEED